MALGIIGTIASVSSIQTILFATVVGLIVYWLIQKRKYRLPPGPFALPVIGNYRFLKEKFPHKWFFELSKTYGPVLRIYLGPYMWIVLNNIEVVYEALVKRGADFADRPIMPSFEMFTEGGKDIAFGRYGPSWKLLRKIAGKALRLYLQGEKMEEKAHIACAKVVQLMTEEKGPFDPANYCDYLVFNIQCAVCFGNSYELNDPEFVNFIKLDNELIETFGTGMLEDYIPYLKEIRPTARFRRLTNTAEELLDMFRLKYKEHKETFDRDNIRDFTDSLILARKEAEDEDDKELLSQVTDTHLIQTLSDIFPACTSRMTINWGILHMAGYPDIQDKVQEELDRVVGKNRFPSLKDRENLGYTEAVLHESMRVSLVQPNGVPHATLCDTKVGGYDVPKGTMVIINHWALHHDPKYWKDVDKFDPTRFLDDNGKLNPNRPESWLPFSAGRRNCLGEPIAKPEIFLLFASLMQRFKIRLPPGETTNFEESSTNLGALPAKYKITAEERY